MDTTIELEAPYAQPSQSFGRNRRAFDLIRTFLRLKKERTRTSGPAHAIATSHALVRTLEDLCKGESGTIAKIHGTTSVRLHLMEMGLTPGTKITVGRVAVMGGPFDITVRGYRLSLRREEARAIELRSE